MATIHTVSVPTIVEVDLARQWHALPLDISLTLTNGETCQLLYTGRPGGPQGPDVRDAVLQFAHDRGTEQRGEHTLGDVEFHVRCSDWYAHGHHRDVRYNNVVLHVVLVYDVAGPVLRQDGYVVPVCSLNDLTPMMFQAVAQSFWPCQCIIPPMSMDERASLLEYAGMQRFEQKMQALLALLHDARPREPFNAYDVCLIPALAEALGYGRDRAFFRAAGMRLVGLAGTLPEPLGHTSEPSPLDAGRLRVLGELVERWRVEGAWEVMRRVILYPPNNPDNLRALFPNLGTARADILICNVILPFAGAVACLEDDRLLMDRARQLYITYPALVSNQVTRAMWRQLGLEREPRSACQQQGLHYVYAQTCQEKRCGDCLVVRRER